MSRRRMSYPQPGVYPARPRIWLTPYLLPACGMVALVVVSAACRWAWAGRGAAPWAALGMAAVTALVALVARVAARPRGALTAHVAVGAVSMCGAWWIAATFAGLGPVTLSLWCLLTVAVSAAHAVMRLLRHAGTDTVDGMDSLARAVRAAARVRKVRASGRRIQADIEAPDGLDAFLADMPPERLAARLDMPPGSVRVTPSPRSARRATVEVSPLSGLDSPLPWPGPSRPGASIVEPTVVGEHADGQPARLWLAGDPDMGLPGCHVLVTGMTGSGKTSTLRVLSAEILSRSDAQMWFADPVKREQTYGPLAHGLTRTADTPERAARMLADLARHVIPERTRHLGERDLDAWTPGCGLPFLVVVVGEAGQVVAGSADFVAAAEAGRSAGVCLVLDMQRPTHDRLPVSARANLSARLVHGCRDAAEAKLALPAEAIEAGAHPHRWQNRRPGMFYLAAPGVEEDRQSLPARAYQASRSQLRDAVAPVDQAPSPVAESPRLRLVPPVDARMGTDQARARLDEAIRDLAEAGRVELAPADLAPVLDETGRSAPWLTAELKARCSGPDAMLREAGRGRYRIVAAVSA